MVNFRVVLLIQIFLAGYIIAQPTISYEYHGGDTIRVISRKYSNGGVDITRTKNGELHGKSEGFYPNGSKMNETFFIDGKEHGVRKGWSENGFQSVYKPYHYGVPVDTHKVWYHNENKKTQEVYDSSGQRHGWAMNWYENGTLQDSTLYEKGEKLEEYHFYECGALLFTSKMRPDGYIVSSESFTTDGKRNGQVKDGNGFVVMPGRGETLDTLTIEDGRVVDDSFHFFRP